jgi:glutamate N-acetyltransferase/amino-acid N-acetyltransferase
MPVNLSPFLTALLNCMPVAGIRLGVAEAGIRKANRKDLTVMLD